MGLFCDNFLESIDYLLEYTSITILIKSDNTPAKNVEGLNINMHIKITVSAAFSRK